MKVFDVMSKQVEYVTYGVTVKEICRLIFGRGINGVPVIKDKKLVGFITEHDVLAKFFPTMEEYMQDPVYSSDFEAMEEKVSEIFSLTADKIMSEKPVTVFADTPLLHAQSLMMLNKVGRLPVIDGKGYLIGIISKGDIFRAAVGDKLPFAKDEEYHDWLSKHYDLSTAWEERLGYEVPDLTALFKKGKASSILDIGCGTGEHDISLAKQGFRMVGMERSNLMFKSAKGKLDIASETVRKRVEFLNGNYIELLKDRPEKFDATIFMGNAFSHLVDDYQEVLSAVVNVLSPEKSTLVFQLINYEKVFKVKKRFLDTNFARSKFGIEYEHAFLEFYDPPRIKGGPLTLTMVVLDFDGKKWKLRSLNSTKIAPVDREEVRNLLKKHNFKEISFYGSQFWGPLFKYDFDPKESDWLNVVARR